MPDIVLEPVLKKLLASGRQEIILDVILSNGTIAPVYIEKKTVTANQPSSQTSSQPIVAALRLEVLDGRGFWQQNVYDDEGQPVKTTLGRENTLVLQRATEEQVAQAFPERADVVRSRNKLLEGNDQ